MTARANRRLQPYDTALAEIANLTLADDDILQQKSGSLTNRTPAQFLADLEALPLSGLEINSSSGNSNLYIASGGDANDYMHFRHSIGGSSQIRFDVYGNSKGCLLDFNPLPDDGTSDATFRIFRATDTTGNVRYDIYKGDGTGGRTHRFTGDGGYEAGNPTGGNKGIGTINAEAVYDDNTLLSDLIQEVVATKQRPDLAKWDALVPDIEVPEIREMVEAYDEVEEAVDVQTVVGDRIEVTTKTVTRRKPRLRELPVYRDGVAVTGQDETGAVVPLTRTVPEMVEQVTPARTVRREHYGARILAEMMDNGFAPWDCKSVRDWSRGKKTLPAMPSAEEWADRNGKISLGEMDTRQWMSHEVSVEALCQLIDMVEGLEARVAVLEKARPVEVRALST